MPPEPISRPLRLIRVQDIVWLFLFGLLAVTSEIGDAFELIPLIALGIVQVLEPRLPVLESVRGRLLWVLLKLGLGYVLIGYTGGVESRYWLVLLLPVVSAATAFGLGGTMLVWTAASGAYLTFLVWVPDWQVWTNELAGRVVLLAIVGNLVNSLAEDLRVQSKEYRRAAEQLAEANVQLRQAEDAVRRSDRLAALGQLTAGLAHELRNPLGTIKASAEMLNRSVQPENEVAREMAGFISSEVDRTNSLVTRFLQFARPLDLRLEKGDLGKTLDRVIAMVERETPNIAIYRNYDPGIAPFRFDGELLERVFYNLALNAAQATPQGGAITVKTRNADTFAEVSIIDRGSGIDRKHFASIFNPFFTTKPDGVGLGLAIVSKIIDEHGGKITVESEPGKGSIFRVFLPMNHAK